MRTRILLIVFTTMLMVSSVLAQESQPYVRIANIVVDSAQLENYKTALKEGIQRAVHNEKGVISLYAVYDENSPTHVTVFEVYASKAAYLLHIQTPHFKKYKAAVEPMVKSLTLTDVIPIALERKL